MVLVRMAMESNKLKDFQVGKDIYFSILQYADDTILLCDVS